MRLRDGKKAGTLLLAVLLLTGCGGAADTASNVETGTAADAATIAAADTAAGTWELVSMTYNGMTVGKEDLEEIAEEPVAPVLRGKGPVLTKEHAKSLGEFIRFSNEGIPTKAEQQKRVSLLSGFHGLGSPPV